MYTYAMNLQLFNNTQTTGSGSLSVEMKTYYDKQLLDNAEPVLVHRQFGMKRPLPKNNGKNIEFRSFSSLPNALQPLTEGVTPNGRSLQAQNITATIEQYGDYVEVSDLLDLTAYDRIILESNKLLGSQAGRTLDTITRDEANAGTNVLYQKKKDGTAVLTRHDLDADSVLTVDTVFEAAAILKGKNTPLIDGSYVGIIHPHVAKDFMIANREAGTWVDINKYSNSTKIFEGEIGKVAGVRFVESSEAKIWKDSTCPALSYKQTSDSAPQADKQYYTKSGETYTATDFPLSAFTSGTTYYEAATMLSVYSVLVIGEGAYGVTDLEGGGLEMFVKQLGSSGTADPLNQRATIGWKAATVTKVLAEDYMVRIETASSFSKKSQAN